MLYLIPRCSAGVKMQYLDTALFTPTYKGWLYFALTTTYQRELSLLCFFSLRQNSIADAGAGVLAAALQVRGGGTYFRLGGQASGVAYARCRRQCIEVRSADQSARSAENFFRLHFSVIRMGSRGTFVLCTARSRCMRIDAAPDQQLDSRTSQG